MIAQYLALKAEAQDALLFFRMGDFYELFFEDAAAAAASLDIALTRRGEHAGQPIPMCGVPAHAHEAYLARLIRAGHRVAIAEQIESPAEARKRGGKSLVARAITRIVTPGTLTEASLLEARRANWLAALSAPLPQAGGAGGGNSQDYPPDTGRPRFGPGVIATFTPRRLSASRSSTSTWALTLRNSPAAARSSASCSAGSRRRAKAFFALTALV